MTATINASTSAGVVVTSDTSGSLALQTANTTAITIDTSQNVGIGTSSPATQLHLSSATPPVIRLQTDTTSSSYGLNWYYTSSSSVKGAVTVNLGAGEMRLSAGESGNTYFQTFYTNAAERARIDSSGNLLVGGTSQSGTANRVAVFSANKFGLSVIDTTAQTTGVGGALNLGGNYRSAGDAQAFARVSAVKQNSTDGDYGYGMAFSVTPNGGTFTEAGRFDSNGYLLIGTTTSTTSARLQIQYTTSTEGTRYVNSSSSSSDVIDFVANSTQVGRINTSGTSTSYVTSSDYRLKENIAPMAGALAKVSQIKPVTYTWKSSGEATQGFIAHELQAVVPECVVGEKDAVDEKGNPKYQGVDTSFLVATLTAAIQELNTLVTTQAQTITSMQSQITALQAKVGA